MNILKKITTIRTKIRVVILIIGLCCITTSLHAQNMSLNLQNTKLVVAMAEVTKQSGYEFNYSPQSVNVEQRVTINIQNKNLDTVLTTLFAHTQIDYIIKGKRVILYGKDLDSDSADQETINGIVADINGVPIANATIVELNSNNGTVSDINGIYSIKASANGILRASYVGFNSIEIAVKNRNTINFKLNKTSEQIDDVVIVGFKKSLSKAIDIKKQNINITDVIVADDIAKFPQSNVAEALQRLTGIQIVRDDAGGVGNQVGIRGLPADHTQVTINGDIIANPSVNEIYNFNTLPSEIFSRIEVAKSPTANMREGGVGGTIDLVLRQPFETDGDVFVISAEGQSNTQQQQNNNNITPKLSATYGKNFNNKFGFITSFAYNEFTNTSEGYDVIRYYEESYDLDNDGIYEYENIRVPRPRLVSQGQEVERLTFNITAQYKINNRINLEFLSLANHNSKLQTRYTPSWFMPGNNPTQIFVNNKFVESISYENVETKLENQQENNNISLFHNTLKLNWIVSEEWKLSVKTIYSASNENTDRYRYYATSTNALTYIVDNKRYFDIKSSSDLTNPSFFTMDEARKYIWNNQDNIFCSRIDINKHINNKLFIDFGASFENRQKSSKHFYNAISEINAPFEPISELLTGFMDNVNEGKMTHQFLVHDFDKTYNLYGSKIDMTNSLQEGESYNVEQIISNAYIAAMWKAEKLKADFGLRFSSTHIFSKQTIETTSENTYTDWLPSVNICYSPIDELCFKTSFAKVMTRPSMHDLSYFRILDTLNNTISVIKPKLNPYRCNQYDLSIEFYPKSDVMIASTIFKKHIASFLTEQTTTITYNNKPYLLYQPVNGNSATIIGLELSYKQALTFLPSPFDGLGVIANYTLSNSDYKHIILDIDETYPMPGNSKHSYNLVGYYEKHGVGVRIAYNYRSSYLREIPNSTDGLKYRDNIGLTDISTSYDINNKLSLTANILNAFNAKKYEYIWEEQYMDNASIFGTTFQFGLRYKL